MRRQARERQENREDRSISMRLRVTLLRLFKELHDEKMLCMRGVPGVTETSERPTAISTQPKQDWGPHHHVEEAID